MSVNMKTRHLTLWIYSSHSDGILSPSPPPKASYCLRQGRSCLLVAYSSPERVGQSVRFCCPFVLYWYLLVGCKAVLVGIRLSVPFKRWGLTNVCVLCVKFPTHSFSGTGGVRFYLTPWDGWSLSGTDLHIYGLVMDGWLQGVLEECEPSSLSEVRPLQSNTQHR